MAVIPFTEKMAEEILGAEISATRFERLCIDVYSELDQRQYVPTSGSWDLGIDGRSTMLQDYEIAPKICCSLVNRVTDKARHDLQRIAANSTIKALRFCSTQPLSEYAIKGIKDELNAIVPGMESVVVDGIRQITSLLANHERFARLFQKRYSGELGNLHAALGEADDRPGEIQATGMRIALTTQFTGDGDELRADIISNLILTALTGKQDLNPALIANGVSQHLHLNKVIHLSYLQPMLDKLAKDGLISTTTTGYSLTENGKRAVKDRTEAGMTKLVQGQKIIREAIKELSGQTLSEGNFNKTWRILQEGIAEMFYQNGMEIIEAIASIGQDDRKVQDTPSLSESIHELGNRVKASALGGPFAEDIGQAVIDMLHDKTSPAFDWLTQVALAYVAICSLGLDPEAQDQVVKRLREVDLFLDTDIVLSFLSIGEADNKTIETVIGEWRRIGGSLYVAIPVLEEVAYHASISENDLQEVFHQLGDYSDTEAWRLITNAFVRGYRVAARGKYSMKTWRTYISNFRGTNEKDYSKIEADLEGNGIRTVAEEAIDDAVAKDFGDLIAKEKAQGIPEDERALLTRVVDKSHRDGRLMAILMKQRAAKRGMGGTAILVSSSSHLRRFADSRKELEGSGKPVMPVGAVAYLLSFVPGVKLSLASLQKLLFDPGTGDRLLSLQRIALRILYDSEQFSVPFARRARLQREMVNKMTQIADESGKQAWEITEEIIRKRGPEQREVVTTIIADALDVIAIAKVEQEVINLKAQLSRLEQENDRLRRKK